MAGRNKHEKVANTFIPSFFSDLVECPRHKCNGSLIPVYVNYYPNGPIFMEYECATCGKVVRDNRVKICDGKKPRFYKNYRRSKKKNNNRRKYENNIRRGNE